MWEGDLLWQKPQQSEPLCFVWFAFLCGKQLKAETKRLSLI
jgi:hypothetical protein